MWLLDPATNKQSVTLTMTIVMFIGCLIAATLNMFGFIEHTSIMLEMFWGILATYIGRRINFPTSSSSRERNKK